ncbi:hypothetical protein PoB_001381800 [Plakobranchus ocellatus]|uniref:Uncharacterized protein n=1 Tax=Plakobranchus ocellatus TaxID=259542 RepID=A0AAV3YY64_9GAST|nr:hypothetical protein PoB_001381800 [Plakobranchus ocellatus]
MLVEAVADCPVPNTCSPVSKIGFTHVFTIHLCKTPRQSPVVLFHTGSTVGIPGKAEGVNRNEVWSADGAVASECAPKSVSVGLSVADSSFEHSASNPVARGAKVWFSFFCE